MESAPRQELPGESKRRQKRPPQGRLPLRKRLRRALLFYLALPPIFLISRLPLFAVRWLGLAAGSAAYYLLRREPRIALENLRNTFGEELGEKEIRRLCRRVFRHTAVSLAEFLVVRRWSPEKIERTFHLAEDFRRMRNEFRLGSIGLTAHCGNWELYGLCCAHYLPGIVVPVANRNSNPKLQRYLERMREGLGLEVIYTDESPRRMLRAIREGKYLALLPDQDLKTPNGTFVEFFGRPAYTTTLPVNLARTTGCPISMGILVREGKGYRLVLRSNLELVWSGDRSRDFTENTRTWSRVLEEVIRQYPEQWMWFHRRWRTQPGDEKEIGRILWTKKTRRRRKLARLSRKDSRGQDTIPGT